MRIIRGIVKALKIYLILDILCWAVVGASHVVEKFREDPYLGIMDCIDEINDETYHRFVGE